MNTLYELGYDDTDPKSIELFASKLIGLTFSDVLHRQGLALTDGKDEGFYGNVSRKGGLGNLLEERYFGYKANSESAPDFPKAGVELKATPYQRNKNGSLRAGERLVLTMIDYNGPVDDDFFKSHLWMKCRLILLIYYLRDRSLHDNLLYPIGYVKLFTPPADDIPIIRRDYEFIISKIRSGAAETLSEGDTMYLGACTKGATALQSIVRQFYPPHADAHKRAFCYKVSYMTIVLNSYIAGRPSKSESVVKSADELRRSSFEALVVRRIRKYVGMKDEDICKALRLDSVMNKSHFISLAFRMLGIRSNKAIEFEKADITVKAIRVKDDGHIVESSSLPQVVFKELVGETWEESTLNDYLSTKKFLFVVFKSVGGAYKLAGSMLWNMPYEDLLVVHREWQTYVDQLRSGIRFTKSMDKNGKIVIDNDLPKKSSTKIIHMRPHAAKAYYRLSDGEVIGDGKPTDADVLPDGRMMTKQSFWLNNSYMERIISSVMKKGRKKRSS